MQELHVRVEVYNCRHFCRWACDSYTDSKHLWSQNLSEVRFEEPIPMRDLHFQVEVYNCRHFCRWVCDNYKDSKDFGARTLARCVSRNQNLCESFIFDSKYKTVTNATKQVMTIVYLTSKIQLSLRFWRINLSLAYVVPRKSLESVSFNWQRTSGALRPY